MIVRSRTSRNGFTLVELLVVIAVLFVLVSLSITVGALVTAGGNKRATQSVLSSLDRALQEYVGITGTVPPYVPNQYEAVPGPDAALTDYEGLMQPRRPDTAVFVSQVSGIGEAGSIINNLPSRFRFARTGIPNGTGAFNRIISAETPSIIDAWGDTDWAIPYLATEQHLVYYVHPDNTLAQDLYGACINGLPYFVSAGADGLYGLNDDDFILEPDDASLATAGSHSHQTVLAAQKDNLTSYTVEPITESAFDRTVSAGVR